MKFTSYQFMLKFYNKKLIKILFLLLLTKGILKVTKRKLLKIPFFARALKRTIKNQFAVLYFLLLSVLKSSKYL